MSNEMFRNGDIVTIPECMKRIKIPLPSEKACKDAAKMFIEWDYAVHIGKEPAKNGKKNQFYLEIWTEK